MENGVREEMSGEVLNAEVKVSEGEFNRLNDRYVKYIWGGEEHKDLLISFINFVLSDIPEGAEPIPPIVDIIYATVRPHPSTRRTRCRALTYWHERRTGA